MKVIKRDGSIEDFDQGKIARVVTAAGLSSDQAETLAANVAEWLKGIQEKKVTTLQIRDKVVDELRKVNEYAANFFVWYEKTKDEGSPQKTD